MQSAIDVEENKTITVIYEDEDVVVINKPSGVSVHNDAHYADATVVDWFLSLHPTAKGVGESQTLQNGEPMERSGVVHRLDRDTSGVMVLAKHQKAYEHLKYQFKQRAAKKEYRAFVYGAMKDRWGTINRPIGRSGNSFKLRSAEPGAKGVLREAVTHFECIGQSHTHAYLKLLPQTGRMHQLRVHLKAVGGSTLCSRDVFN
jgi:23S rRNA pseudouridine1911/1915/1917 synthase